MISSTDTQIMERMLYDFYATGQKEIHIVCNNIPVPVKASLSDAEIEHIKQEQSVRFEVTRDASKDMKALHKALVKAGFIEL